MTYPEYKYATIHNCMSVLSECSYDELFDLEHIKRLLWGDDRVTGVFSGCCSSTTEGITAHIDEVLYDDSFLRDAHICGIDHYVMMNASVLLIDVTVRCICLLQINILELVNMEIHRRNRICFEN